MHLIGQELPDLDTAYGRAIRERTLLPVAEGGLGLVGGSVAADRLNQAGGAGFVIKQREL
jgi:hypothetical protein